MGCPKKLNRKEKGELVALLKRNKEKLAKGQKLCKTAREYMEHLKERFEKYGAV